MSNLNIVSLDLYRDDFLASFESFLPGNLSMNVTFSQSRMDIKDFYRQERKQYDAQAIISAYEKIDSTKRTILLTNLDLFIPIFTFVFGLAKLNGHVGIVSTYRLRTEFYGLPSDPILLKMRLSKEILHEFGHLQNLRHCPDYRCVMASSNTADDLDIKSNHFCNSCLKKMPLV